MPYRPTSAYVPYGDLIAPGHTLHRFYSVWSASLVLSLIRRGGVLLSLIILNNRRVLICSGRRPLHCVFSEGCLAEHPPTLFSVRSTFSRCTGNPSSATMRDGLAICRFPFARPGPCPTSLALRGTEYGVPPPWNQPPQVRDLTCTALRCAHPASHPMSISRDHPLVQ